jgi:hypothetical protein
MQKVFVGLGLFMGLGLVSLTLFMVSKLLTLNCEISWGSSPMGARHCPSGFVIMD